MLIIPLAAILLVWYALILTRALGEQDEPRITRPLYVIARPTVLLPETQGWRDRQTQVVTADPVPIWTRTTLEIAVAGD